MNKKQKEYVLNVHERFENAENHGGHGNWHYPKPYVIAYNVKMRNFADVEDFRKALSELQNDYYKNEFLQESIWTEQNDTCQLLIDDIKETYGLESWFAGRSGGWIEVDYSKHALDPDESTFKDAKALETLETEIANLIEERHKSYNEYVGNEEYYKNLAESLDTDEDIKSEYKRQIDELQAKINNSI